MCTSPLGEASIKGAFIAVIARQPTISGAHTARALIVGRAAVIVVAQLYVVYVGASVHGLA
jgi:hypothetical protein